MQKNHFIEIFLLSILIIIIPLIFVAGICIFVLKGIDSFLVFCSLTVMTVFLGNMISAYKLSNCLENDTKGDKAKTRDIIKKFADGIILIEKGRITLINSKAENFFGLESRNVIGERIDSLNALSKIADLIKKKAFRERVLLKQGLLLEVSVTSLFNQGAMIILHDITREEFIENLKTEFVSIAAHQLRTPISAIKWILRMMLDGDLGKFTREQKEYLERAYISNERMIKLINDLLNITKIEEGRFLYNTKKENLVEIIEKAIEGLRITAKKKGLKLEFKKPKKGFPKIDLDAEKMTLAIQNLVDNAVSYTKEGSVVIAIDFRNNNFIVTVKDTGVGIPPQQEKRVFGRFFRADNAVKMDTEGSGLGLFIAKNIIEAHKGKIWFETEQNKGTVFFFTLPIKKHENFNH